MKPAVVVDVGNSRIKWARCSDSAVVETASLPHDDPPAWEQQCAAWKLASPSTWAVSGVAPQRRDTLIKWLTGRGHQAILIDDPSDLPLRVIVERPNTVGIDRLLNAVAANARRRSNQAAIIVDAGSAVTVDQLTADGSFSGGAISPGLRLMSRALHDYTALLPVVDVTQPAPMPAGSTIAAIQAGVFWSVVGGICALVQELIAQRKDQSDFALFLTGGDAALLEETLRASLESVTPRPAMHVWPAMTLEGLRLAAEALP
jgi:type III pantothenate kinase